MHNDYWLGKWKKSDIAFHEEEVTAELVTYLEELNLSPGDRIFVPLCGKTKDMAWLAQKGFEVIGAELSSIACESFFAELSVTPQIYKYDKLTKYRYNNIELICGDIFDVTSADLPNIDVVYDCKALIALPSDLRRKYLDHIVAILGDKIKVLLLTRESNCKISPPPFPVSKDEVYSLYGAYFNIKVLKHQAVVNIPDRLVKRGYAEMIESVYLMYVDSA